MDNDFQDWLDRLGERLRVVACQAKVHAHATAMRELCEGVGQPHESDILIPEQHARFVQGEKVGLKYADYLPIHRSDCHPNAN